MTDEAKTLFEALDELVLGPELKCSCGSVFNRSGDHFAYIRENKLERIDVFGDPDHAGVHHIRYGSRTLLGLSVAAMGVSCWTAPTGSEIVLE